MADTILFDRLTYIDRLKRAGVDDTQARAHAEAMDDALRGSVATKADLRIEIARLENKIESEITRLENKIGSESARLETKIDLAVRDVTIRIGAMLVALFAALASIKFFG
jgi:hypothetical protein